MPESKEVYAIYDMFENRIRGGFPSPYDAEEWLTGHPLFDIVDTEGFLVTRVATAFEADLYTKAEPTKGYSSRETARDTLVICYDYGEQV